MAAPSGRPPGLDSPWTGAARTLRRGIDLRLGTATTRILPGEGVLALRPDGTETRIAARATILATGGYGANAEMFARLHAGMPLYTTASPTSDGSGHAMAEELGAALRNMHFWKPALAGIEDPPGSGRVHLKLPTRNADGDVCDTASIDDIRRGKSIHLTAAERAASTRRRVASIPLEITPSQPISKARLAREYTNSSTSHWNPRSSRSPRSRDVNTVTASTCIFPFAETAPSRIA
jgi:hypothetical protein